MSSIVASPVRSMAKSVNRTEWFDLSRIGQVLARSMLNEMSSPSPETCDNRFGSGVGGDLEASADLRSAQDIVCIRAPRAVHSSFGGGVSILNLGTGQYFRLDGVGADIWNILARPVTIDAIARMISADYGIETATAEATVGTFVDSMRQAGLVAAS